MKVKELIEALQSYNEDFEVKLLVNKKFKKINRENIMPVFTFNKKEQVKRIFLSIECES